MKRSFLGLTVMMSMLAMIPTAGDAQETFNYSTPDYHYNYDYCPNNYRCCPSHMNDRYHRSNYATRIGRGFEEPDFFSSGVSSYQGTSTGPGPNGGYPGSPRGNYPTNYVDTSVYPNSMTHYPKH